MSYPVCDGDSLSLSLSLSLSGCLSLHFSLSLSFFYNWLLYTHKCTHTQYWYWWIDRDIFIARQCTEALTTTIHYACWAPGQGSALRLLLQLFTMLVGPPGKAVHWGSYYNYSLCLLGPRARQCTEALTTTIHYACWAPGQGSALRLLLQLFTMLVGPPGKAVHWGSYYNYSLCLLGPRARQCTEALTTTIHYACWAPGQGSALRLLLQLFTMLVRPPPPRARQCTEALALRLLLQLFTILVGPPGKAVHWGSYYNYSLCLLGPPPPGKAVHWGSCTEALTTTIHYTCWAPGQGSALRLLLQLFTMLVRPPPPPRARQCTEALALRLLLQLFTMLLGPRARAHWAHALRRPCWVGRLIKRTTRSTHLNWRLYWR